MADVTAVTFLFRKLPVIIWKVCDTVLILLLKNRLKDGSKLGQIAAGTACIAGLCRCLDAGFPVHVFCDALMDRPVLIDQVVIIFVIRIKILKLSLIQIDRGRELSALRFEIGHGGGTGKWNRHGIVALVNQFEGVTFPAEEIVPCQKLLIYQREAVLQIVRIIEYRQDTRHPPEIVGIM